MGLLTYALMATLLGPILPILYITNWFVKLLFLPLRTFIWIVLLPLRLILLPITIPIYLFWYTVKSVAWLFLWPIFLPWRIASYII